MELNIGPKEEIHLRLERNDTRKSQLHELLHDGLIAIEQTVPPIKAAQIGGVILLTYCPNGKKEHRLGMEVRIHAITPDCLIILHRLSDPVLCDLRIWPRIRLDLLPEVKAFCHEKEIQVIDISGGGTHIILRQDDCAIPEIGAIVNMKFVFEKAEITMEGEILRKWTDPYKRNHVAVKFRGRHNIGNYIY